MDKKILIFIPTRNTARTIEKTYNLIPAQIKNEAEFIVVDNASVDNSVQVAQQLKLPVIRHDSDRGYGGSNKTAFDYAIKNNADLLVILHSDCQYDPTIMDKVLEPALQNKADAVFGSRILGKRALEGGMPWWKYISNRFLTWVENAALHTNISEYHTGYRVYTVHLLRRVPYHCNSDNWLFDSEIIFQICHLGFKIQEVPIPTHYGGTISSVSFSEGVVYGLAIFWLILKFKLHVWNIIKQDQFM
jgi:glycosyltransferase involved in cell wall biosynthesis